MGDFGSCDDIQLGFDEIKKLASDTYANATWVDALSAVNGIYLVLDNSDGRMYVGSAYGGNGIFGRWAKYAKIGHGGNKELKDLDPRELEFSILEIAPPTLSADEIIERENRWNKRLRTREFGLNSN